MFRFTNPARFLSKLLSFTESLDREIPAKALDKNLVLGTWNIRDLNEKGRLDESYAYISEVVSRYDILAVQELKTSLTPIDRLKEHLGTHWEYVVSHPCMTPKGNYERMAFIYDTRRVKFSGVSSYVTNFGKRGEIGLEEFSRSPYMAGFSVGDFKFFLCNVHLYYDSGRSKSEFRRKEIKYLMEQLEKGSLKSKYGFTVHFLP